MGGGFAAAEEAIFLTRYARHVTVLVRGDDFTCAGSIADEVKRHEQITVLYNTAMLEVGGGDVLRYAVYENCKTGERTRYETSDATFGVFVFAGYVPVGGPLLNGLETDCEGYLVTDMDQRLIWTAFMAPVTYASKICGRWSQRCLTALKRLLRWRNMLHSCTIS